MRNLEKGEIERQKEREKGKKDKRAREVLNKFHDWGKRSRLRKGSFFINHVKLRGGGIVTECDRGRVG